MPDRSEQTVGGDVELGTVCWCLLCYLPSTCQVSVASGAGGGGGLLCYLPSSCQVSVASGGVAGCVYSAIYPLLVRLV